MIIEIDGSSHDTKLEYDEQRQLKLEKLGYTVLRITESQVMKNIEGVVEVIKQKLDPPTYAKISL